MQLGWPLPKRKEFIEKLLKRPGRYKRELEWRGGQIELLDVYAVPLEMPKYRLANGRTGDAQDEYVAKHPEVGDDFFTRDLELQQAHEVQHGILKEMVDREGLIKFFRTNKQAEPFILDHLGFIVNGNRRLCAMRMLYEADAKTFAHFGHVDAIILPPCDERAIDELESRLQLQPDIKEKYTWTARAIMLRHKRERQGYTDEDLKRIYNLGPKQIQEQIAILELAEEYLERRGKPKHYSFVENDDFALQQLRKCLKETQSEGERSVLKALGYLALEKPEGQEGRLYAVIPQISEHLKPIVERCRTELTLQPIQQDVALDDLLGSADPDLSSLAVALDNPANRERVQDIVQDVIESQDAAERQRDNADFALSRIREANTKLLQARSALGPSSTKSGIKEHLDAIQTSLEEIRKWLANNP